MQVQLMCELALSLSVSRVCVAWRGRAGQSTLVLGSEPGCRIHMPQGTALPTGSQQAVSGLGPRPSSWDPSLGSFLPEIQSRA